MAQKVQVLLIDDLEGGEADETVEFGLDGKQYVIDLKDKNAKKLRKALEPFLAAGRKTGGGRGGSGKRSAGSKAGGGQDTAAIRSWAKENGFEVNDRGRVPANIREAYEKASA
ncbi:hypothetical protein SMD44_07359 [Streptomyces alboflavus]|uniref:Lsr2 family protein n=1 Tax=Streptomyces alboflavus TaxID=67267 RepID=A0A1Z1WN47_9ACTN|nr:Lsr2 family protein [Streptomyces alboflavus]ARX87877.1 hypothetical protein SMD44_07359 [Streptomyces alboflavus]